MKSDSDRKYAGKVLVLGSDNRAFLSVIRSLGRKNINVHVGWCAEDSQALRSKYIVKFHAIPAFSSTNDWQSVLLDILRKEEYDLVIPCNDSSIIPLQLHKNEFSDICKIYLLEDECYRIANDKFEMQKLASKLEINIPKEVEVSNTTTVDHLLSEIPLPVVLKPQASFTLQDIREKNFVVKVFTSEELKNHLSQLKNGDVLSAQENFIGKGVGVELLAKEGKILYSFQHVRVHEPLTGGGSSYRKSVSVHPELLRASEKIIGSLNYTGVAMVEFKMNLATNDWVFIELNARFWGSLPLAVAAGADFPYYLYSMLVNGEVDFKSDYQKGIYCRNLTKDLGWLVDNIKADHSNPFLETVPYRKVAAEIFNVLSYRERNDTFVMDDYAPAIAEFNSIFSKVNLKISKTICSNRAVRAMQKRKVLKRVKMAKKILFVCKGNICRSPFAHYYLKSIVSSEVTVESCGYFPKDGRPCPEAAIKAGEMLGIDMNGHRSVLISADIIQNADIIFTFDEQNKRTIVSRYPAAKSKTFRISSLDTHSPFEIFDPYSRDIDYFRETYGEIKKLLDFMK